MPLSYDTEMIINKIVGVPVVFQNGIGGLELIRERLGVGYGTVVTYGITRSGNVAEVRGVGEIMLPSLIGEVADTLRLVVPTSGWSMISSPTGG
ncbi:hypothetical protein [Vulcanisaeta sp. JCM 16161]|uniref:hypothetical protein n=1 Tax=Vulcanisaeta sp. JCM 16161 TaxID=1295372 RepID=UPI000A799227|nr:hypothetical protein [Vulcanisaeta sp. JCM 16161]